MSKMKKKQIKTPSMLQMEATECGAASLGMVLAYYGLWLPLEKLRLECGVNRDGSKASNIVKAARRFQCEAKGFRWSAERILEVEYPLIIHWEFNHFVVLEGFKNGKAYINDPAAGHRTIDWEDFRTSYTGIALQIRPNKEFVKQGGSFHIIKVIAKKLLEDKWTMLFMLLIGLFMIIPGLAVPIMSQVFLDDILTGRHADWMFNWTLGMIIAIILNGVLVYLRSWCLTNWQKKLTLSDSAQFFWHILRMPATFFQQRYGGEVASRVQFNEEIASTLSSSAATALLDFFVAIFYLILLLQYSVKLTLIGLAFTTINILLLLYLRKRLTEMMMKIQQDAAKAYGTAMNGIQMIETLKANGNEADFFVKWVGYRTKAIDSTQKVELLSQSLLMVPLFLSGINTALIMTIGGFEIMEGFMTAGIFMAFQSLMTNFQTPVNNLLGLGQSLQTTEMQMMRLADVQQYEIDQMNYPQDTNKLVQKEYLAGELTIKNLSYGYSPLEAPLIQDFSLHVKPGRWVALIGGSGSGKSTVAKMVAGLYEEWSGEIQFDGILRRDMPRQAILNSVACVDQDIVLFSGSIYENLSMFNQTVSRQDVMNAAKDACIHEDIMKIEGNYEGWIDEGGRNFSGGQRQRLEIARALTNNPAILIFDEATSALDPITEEQVIKNIRRRGCTCLVIAHRLSTIRDCDEIIVLERGQIVQRGTHTEMIKIDGYYRNLLQADTSNHAIGGE